MILDLKPLCKNEYTINGTQKFFARTFNFIPPLEEDYGYVSYDEETLFTNIPLKETIDNTIDQIHVQKKLAPICTKLMIKRLLLKLATECKFTFLNSFYQQTDERAIGSPLAVTFSDNYVVKLENDIVMPPKPKFYRRYVDDMCNRRKVILNDILFE